MFGLLARTRCIETRNTIAFPIDTPKRSVRVRLESDHRIGLIDRNNTRWFTFELSTDSDLHDALNWLGDAYDAARVQKEIHVVASPLVVEMHGRVYWLRTNVRMIYLLLA